VISNLNLFHYYVSGSTVKPVILFLHGFLGTANDWHEVISALSPHYYCLAVDLPGHGQTKITGDGTSYTIKTCATGIIDILRHLNMDSCYMVGYSMGGRLALYLAVTYPKIFHKVVLESASPGLKTRTERKHRWLHDLHLAQQLQCDSLQLFLNSWYQQPIFNSMRKHRDFSNLLEKRLHQDGKQLAHALRGMSVAKEKPLWNKLRKIKLPILLITGALDFKFSEIMQEMHHLLPQAELQIVEECGHNVHFENPDIFVKKVREFF
jgi:2-succinyl-6-hydroxy-2,4-cyclohexadiene-1-carboxylate synthase